MCSIVRKFRQSSNLDKHIMRIDTGEKSFISESHKHLNVQI